MIGTWRIFFSAKSIFLPVEINAIAADVKGLWHDVWTWQRDLDKTMEPAASFKDFDKSADSEMVIRDARAKQAASLRHR